MKIRSKDGCRQEAVRSVSHVRDQPAEGSDRDDGHGEHLQASEPGAAGLQQHDGAAGRSREQGVAAQVQPAVLARRGRGEPCGRGQAQRCQPRQREHRTSADHVGEQPADQ